LPIQIPLQSSWQLPSILNSPFVSLKHDKCDKECFDECREEDFCEEVCEEKEIDEGNETVIINICEDVCEVKKVCSQTCEERCDDNCFQEEVCETYCETYDQCDEVCEQIQSCFNDTKGELSIDGNCHEDWSGIWIGSWGDELEIYNDLNEWEDDKRCEDNMEALVNVRKALQNSVDDDFAAWFFEDFRGNDPDKITNGEYGFRAVIDTLIRNEEEIADNLYCDQDGGRWPDGFSKIDVTYKRDNINVEVWEKRIPVESGERYWTTLYKYSWVPDKELLKELIDYQLSEQDTFGPNAKDVDKIKEDQGKMEIVKKLGEKFGGSFDIKLEMVQDGNTVVKKYLQINEDVVVHVTDNIKEKEDFSIEIDFNVFHEFMTYMSLVMDGNRIEGPRWVYVEQDGAGMFFGFIGAVSKMWREGVKIKPRFALFKIFFSVKDIFSLMREQGIDTSTSLQGEEVVAVPITGKSVWER